MLKKNRIYRSYMPWIWYVLPAPILLFFSRRKMASPHVWWQKIENGKVTEVLSWRKV